MAHDRCIALIAPMRTGTTTFLHSLGHTPHFHNFGEVLARNGHFERWLQWHPLEGIRLARGTDDATTRVCDSYFRKLGQLTRKPIFLVDIKHSTLPRIGSNYANLLDPPFFLRWLTSKNVKIILLRRDPFEQAVSLNYAWASKVWRSSEAANRPTVRLQPDSVRSSMEKTIAEYRIVDDWLANYGPKLSLRYEDLFADDSIAAPVLTALADFIRRPLDPPPGLAFAKVLEEPRRLIANYDEIIAQLRPASW